MKKGCGLMLGFLFFVFVLNAQDLYDYKSKTDFFTIKTLLEDTNDYDMDNDPRRLLMQKRHNVLTMPLQYFRSAVSLGYEHIFPSEVGGMVYYLRHFPTKLNEIDFSIRYYFAETRPHDIPLSFHTIKNIGHQFYAGVSNQTVWNSGALQEAIRAMAGVRSQLYSGLNLSVWGAAGQGWELKEPLVGKVNKPFFSWSVRVDLGYRFKL